MIYEKIQKKIKYKITKIRAYLPKIATKSELINWFANKYKYSSYLEISTLETGNYFDQVDKKLYTVKECLNYYMPGLTKEECNMRQRSDHNIPFMEYEEHFARLKNTYGKFDVILVDSYHTFAQTKKDIEAAMQLVSRNGIIIVHDCNPHDPAFLGEEKIPDNTWWGQTYEAFIDFRLNNPQIESSVVDIDFGCGIIRLNKPAFNPLVLDNNLAVAELAKWEYFSKHNKYLLNLISVNQFKKHYRNK